MKIILSAAMSLDGHIDDATDSRLVLSSREDWQAVYELRSRCDAILVGAGTIRKDNPSLGIKDAGLVARRVAAGLDPEPAKVVVSGSGQLPAGCKFLSAGSGRRIVYHSNDTIPEGVVDGVEYVYCSNITAAFIRADMERRGYGSLLVEGGTGILTMFLGEGVADELRLAVAPFFVGDAAAPRFVAPGLFPHDKNRRMRLDGVERLGDMAVMHYKLQRAVDREYLAMAVEESRKSVPCDSCYRVGAVVVTASGDIFKGYTHQTSVHNHAEEEAIAAALAAGAELRGATMYSSMEPCSKRSSKPESCSSLILRYGFVRAVFAFHEPDHFVKCEGADILRRAGVEVVHIADLSDTVARINAHVLCR